MPASLEFSYSTTKNPSIFSFLSNRSGSKADELIHIEHQMFYVWKCELYTKYSYRIVFEISWLKKIFCDDRTSKQTYAFTPNLLCNHFSIQVIHMSNLKILDLIVLKISRYRKFVWVGLTNEQTDGYKPKI